MSVAQYVFRRGATYVWRRRFPVDAPEEGVLQVSLRTRDPHRAGRIAAVVTAESSAIFNTMVQKRLTPKEARALFDRVVREESERLSKPTAPLSHFRARRPSLKIPEADRFQLYALSLLRALRQGEMDEEGENLLNHIRTAWGDEAFSDACYHFNDEALNYAAPFLRDEDRQLAEETVNAALRRTGGVDDEELLAAYRLVLTARAAALDPKRGLTIKSAAEIRPSDDLDPDEPMIPRAWFEDAVPAQTYGAANLTAGPSAPPEAHDQYAPSITEVVERVISQMEDDGTSLAQQKQIRQSAELFAELADVTDIREIRQFHIARFADLLRRLPKSYGKSTRDRGRPLAELIEEAADLSPEERGLSTPTINRHLGIIERLMKRAGAEGLEIDARLDFDALRRRDTRRGREKRQSFSSDDIQKIFRHPVFTGSKSAKRRRTPGSEIIRDALY